MSCPQEEADLKRKFAVFGSRHDAMQFMSPPQTAMTASGGFREVELFTLPPDWNT